MTLEDVFRRVPASERAEEVLVKKKILKRRTVNQKGLEVNVSQ